MKPNPIDDPSLPSWKILFNSVFSYKKKNINNMNNIDKYM